MSRIVIEYNPPLSMVVQKIIRNEVSPSMISNDETSCQYDISMVAECLNEVFDQGLEEVEVETDLKLINQFMDEGVHYIEF
jgi:hypothetical protein